MITVTFLLAFIIITNAFPTDHNSQQVIEFLDTENENTEHNSETALSDLIQSQKDTIKKILSSATTKSVPHSDFETIPQYTRKCVTILRNDNENKSRVIDEDLIQGKSNTFNDDVVPFQNSKQLEILSNQSEETFLEEDKLPGVIIPINKYHESTTSTYVPESSSPQTTAKYVSTETNTDNLLNIETKKNPNKPVLKRTCMIIQEQIETTIRRNGLENRDQHTTPSIINIANPVTANLQNTQADSQMTNVLTNGAVVPQFAIMQPFPLDNLKNPYGPLFFYTYRKYNEPHYQLDTSKTAPTVPSPTTSATTTARTTTTTRTSTTTSTSSTIPNPIREPIYAPQMKFVLPMTYAGPENPSTFPWQFDQYAYYPKYMQPSIVNVPVPYNPTFHMIRSLTIPRHSAGNYYIPNTQYANYEKKE